MLGKLKRLIARIPEPTPEQRVKTFYLLRTEDVSGVSGTGVVAVGVQLPSGKCIMEWLSKTPSRVEFENPEHLETVHGHEGRTKIIWD